jgi:inner membrane protein
MQVPVKKTPGFWNSITFKLIIIGLLILVMLIPGALVKNLIRERSATQQEVIAEISSKWGMGQTLTGPVLTIPYFRIVTTEKKTYREMHYAHFLPEELNVNLRLEPEMRYRGIYRTVVYEAGISVDGRFGFPDPGELKIDPGLVAMEDAFLQVGITDMRGIKEKVIIQWNGSPLDVEPGIPSKDITLSGLHADVPLQGDAGFSFHYEIALTGSDFFYLNPVGKETNIRMHSSWGNPKFDGAFLPDERSVSDDGFTAGWKVLHLNRNYPQSWKGAEYSVDESAFGVHLLLPVDQYLKTERSAKYAIMFIALTFMVFFFVEILNRKRIHPVQYLLVGLSISIFYVLLLSLAEQIGYNPAYLISAVATVAMITAYSTTLFRNTRLSFILACCLIILYVFLFTIIQLQDYALLMGSIGLFAALGIIMYASRKVDWYSTTGPGKDDRNIGF